LRVLWPGLVIRGCLTMAGSGPPPKEDRQRRGEPVRGDWQSAPGVGWQHGEVPKPPPNLRPVSREAWGVWFAAWFASHWTPDDLPMLRQVIRLYDKVERDDASAADLTQFRQLIDSYGITPKGQQDRRWSAPKDEPNATAGEPPAAGRYGHLRAVNE
jgi:hypothetical protein